MTTERDPATRTVLSWLREDAYENAERVLLRSLDEVDATPQRRSWWPARRSTSMNTYARYAIAAAAVLVVALVGYSLLPRGPSTGGQPTAAPTVAPTSTVAPTASALATPEPSLPPGMSTSTPFGSGGLGMCPLLAADATCIEDPRDESITFTFTIPDSWPELDFGAWIDENAPPGGAAVTFARGSWLYSEPCTPDDEGLPDIRVGPTVADFVTALDEHPLLDVSDPVDVTLAGHSGKYLDLRVPDDISACARYRPIDQHIYAQGPGQRWHMWVLDVGGVRVVVEGNDYAGTSAARLAEEQAIIDSLVITP